MNIWDLGHFLLLLSDLLVLTAVLTSKPPPQPPPSHCQSHCPVIVILQCVNVVLGCWHEELWLKDKQRVRSLVKNQEPGTRNKQANTTQQVPQWVLQLVYNWCLATRTVVANVSPGVCTRTVVANIIHQTFLYADITQSCALLCSSNTNVRFITATYWA